MPLVFVLGVRRLSTDCSCGLSALLFHDLFEFERKQFDENVIVQKVTRTCEKGVLSVCVEYHHGVAVSRDSVQSNMLAKHIESSMNTLKLKWRQSSLEAMTFTFLKIYSIQDPLRQAVMNGYQAKSAAIVGMSG